MSVGAETRVIRAVAVAVAVMLKDSLESLGGKSEPSVHARVILLAVCVCPKLSVYVSVQSTCHDGRLHLLESTI